MSALSDALRNAAAERGWSARETARQAKSAGYSVNHDTVARYFRGDHGRPDEATLRAFSDTLGLPLVELRHAADLPTDVTEPYRPPPEAARLSRRQRKAVDEIIRAMIDPTAQSTRQRPAELPDPHLVEHRRAARRGRIEQSD